MKEAFYNCVVCNFSWVVTWDKSKKKHEMRDTCPHCLDYETTSVTIPYFESEARKHEQADQYR